MDGLSSRSRPTGWRRTLCWLVIASLLTVPGLGPGMATSATEQSAPAIELVSYGRDAERATLLDPLTLADRETINPRDAGGPYGGWLRSADGSTRVAVRFPGDGLTPAVERDTIVVADGASGEERLRFQPPERGSAVGLSRDGGRLVIVTGQSGSPSGVSQPTWYALDTRDGGVLAKIAGEGQGFGPYGFLTAIFDPEGRYLHRPFVPGGRAGDGPLPLQIVANDLTTGEEVARISLPSIQAESWWPGAIEQLPVNQVMAPAVALSPEGDRIAIVHADAEHLTLIDTPTLTIERTIELTQPESLGDGVQSVLGWLGLVPRSAEAKIMTGRVLQAVFAPDGRSLYLAGREGSAGETMESVEEHGLGVRRINLTTGEIVAESLGDALLDELLPTPDGSALYVYGPTESWFTSDGEPPYRLFLLDPRTLEPLAQREFPAARRIAVLPVGSPSTMGR